MRHAREESDNAKAIAQLMHKLDPAKPYPDNTIGVFGGQVQWVLGNPFPIRICNYDGEKGDLPNLDERGQWCRQWFEPAQGDL